MLTRVFFFPSSPCPALSYANRLYLGKAKAVLLYFHSQGSEFPCMTSRLVRDAQRHLLATLARVEAEGNMLSWLSVLLRLLGLSSPPGMLSTGACILLGKEKNLISLSEFQLFMLLHVVASMDKISTLENCFSLTAGNNLIVVLTMLGFPDCRFAACA